MVLDDAMLDTVARLARLELSEAERAQMRQELQGVFALLDALGSASLADVEPLAHVLPLTQPLREDRVTEPNCQELLLALAPAAEEGLYLVPRVIE